jgi:hypothetical protein
MSYFYHMWRYVFIVWFVAGLGMVRAQTDEMIPGTLYLANGDSMSGFFGPFKEERLSRLVKFTPNMDTYPQNYNAREVKAFELDERRFESQMVDEREQFVKAEQMGELVLYSQKDRVKKRGDYVTIVRYFVRREGSDKIHEITEKNFRKEMPIHIADHTELAAQVRDKFYEYSDLQALVEAYNTWVEKGRPATSWTKENGNYTIGVSHEPEVKESPDKDLPTSRLAVEATAGLSLNIMEFDEYAYNNILGYTFTTPGPGYQLSLGVRYRVSEHFSVRGGVSHFNKSFRIEYPGTDITTGEQFRITETWSNRFFSGYAIAEYQSQDFFFGGGFDLTFAQTSSQTFRASSMASGEQFDLESSLLIAQVEPQFDFIMNMGFNFSTDDHKWRFRPHIGYHIPLNRLFTFREDLTGGLGQELNGAYPVSQFNFRIGLIVEYGLN